jgi:hypothetical protein
VSELWRQKWLRISERTNSGMNIPPMSYVLLLLPFCISLALLGAILLLREHQNAVIQKGLIDRLLVSQGHNPLPDIEPIAELTGEAKKAEIGEKIEEAIRKIKHSRVASRPVSFAIPGMPQPRVGMGEVKK